jgi:hypothetical protein
MNDRNDMTPTRQRNLTLIAVLGLAWWLFGNLYEAVVISPNWVQDSPAQFARLHGFFAVTGPTLYFIPVTQLAVVLTWWLWWRNRDIELAGDYRHAGLASLLLEALNTYIVIALISNMFGDDALAHHERLSALAWQWNILNTVRIGLIITTMTYLFGAFRTLDRRTAAVTAPDG